MAKKRLTKKQKQELFNQRKEMFKQELLALIIKHNMSLEHYYDDMVGDDWSVADLSTVWGLTPDTIRKL